VNIFSAEDRTRTCQNLKRRPSRFQSFDEQNDDRNDNRKDEQFERELPPEIRAELNGNLPRSKNRRPIRPAIPTPPPAGEATVPPIAKPVQRESRPHGGSWIWWLLASVGVVFLLARLSDNRQPRTSNSTPVEVRQVLPPAVEVRRALPVVEVRRALPAIEVRRALPVNSVPSAVPNIGWQSIKMPDGSVIPVHYEGELPSSAALPLQGHFIGEEYSTGNTSWVWMTPAGTNVASWVDP